MPISPLRVTVWNEFRHEQNHDNVRDIYPDGIHAVIATAIKEHLGDAVTVRTATLDEPEHGLTEEVLTETDVLTWWGHCAHHVVEDEIAARVQDRVHHGMGLVVLHSGHFSKVFRLLMGTGCGLKWREAGELERIWVVNPGHPIADGLGDHFEIQNTEMYGELFDIPEPDELIFISWFEGGEVFRSGCTWRRGKGKIFYFRPGHETFPIYHNKDVQRVIAQGVKWAAPNIGTPYDKGCPEIKEPLSAIATEWEVDESLHESTHKKA